MQEAISSIFRSSSDHDLESNGDMVTLAGDDIEFIVNSVHSHINGWIVKPYTIPAKVS